MNKISSSDTYECSHCGHIINVPVGDPEPSCNACGEGKWTGYLVSQITRNKKHT